jgi:hypothetical protein
VRKTIYWEMLQQNQRREYDGAEVDNDNRVFVDV